MFDGKSILITGGTGSFGKKFTKTLLEQHKPRRVVIFSRDELTELAGGAISYRQVAGGRSDLRMTILHEKYAPGADTGRSMLRHEAQEGGVVIRGRLEVIVGGNRRVLGPGDAYYFDSRTPHRFRNIGEEEAEIVSACTPPSF